ncbi:MAG TPA: PAS domain S-box protein, partial [Bryobacteraceae bacterium]|nr:PAS domain S-box protein [Bryobacteraceae bacterium]
MFATTNPQDVPREEYENLRLFIEYAPLAIAMFDRNMCYLAASRRWRNDYGLGDRNLVGLSHYDVLPEIPERWKEIHRRALAGAVESAEADPFPRADGSVDWVRWEIRPWRNSLNQIGGIIVFAEKITERKQAEEALRRSEQTARERQQEIEEYYRNAPVGLCVLDTDLRYVRINDQLAAMNGLPSADHVGRSACEVLPQCAAQLESLMQRIRTTGEPVRDVEFEWESETEPGMCRYLVQNWFPMRDACGNVCGANVVVEEVTARKRLELALQASEERLRVAALAAKIGIWSWNCATDEFIVDADWRGLFGVPANVRVTSQTWINALHPDDRERAVAERKAACVNRVDLNAEYRVVMPDGSIRWLLDRGRATYGPDGRAVRMAGVNADITERKRAEEVLRHYELLAEHSRDIVMYMRRDDGRIIEANAAAAQAYGYTRDELRSLSISDLRADGGTGLTAEQMDEADEHGLLFETLHRRKDGSVFPVEVSSRGATIRGVRTLLSVVRDITARKQTEEMARQWQRAFEQTELGISLASTDETFLDVNAAFARQHGYAPEELKGTPIAGIYPPEEQPRVAALVQATDLGSGHSVFESVHQRKDGTRFPVLVDLTVVRDAGGRAVSRVVFVHDLTERKQSEERLRQTQKLESIALLAGGVAHDFNNLLTGVMGYASLLLEEVPPRAAETVRAIISGAERAAHLTRQLLAYSGKGQFYVRDLDLSHTVRELLGLIQPSIPRSIYLRLDLQERLPEISVDPGQLQQVLMNLVTNARDAIGESRRGTIVISTRQREIDTPLVDEVGQELPAGRYVCLEVRDDGAGMTEETTKKIFDPFFTTKFTGRGLGLSAVAGIMRTQKGGILIETALGCGSTFTLLFPEAGARACDCGQDAADAS